VYLGCHIGYIFCGALDYADDVIPMTPTLFSLRRMLSICTEYASEYDVVFNSSKSKLLYFGACGDKPPVSPVKFMGNIIELVSHDKHLGNIIGQNCGKVKIHESINEFNRKVNMVNTHFRRVQFDVLYQLFKTYCMPLYGSQIWDHSCVNVYKFYVSWRKAIRKILDLPYSTVNYFFELYLFL